MNVFQATILRGVCVLLTAVFAVGLAPYLVAEDKPSGEPVVVSEFTDSTGMFAHGSWRGAAAYRDGQLIVEGPGVDDRGGAGREEELDLSAHVTGHLAVVGKALPGNQTSRIILQLVDADGTKCNWVLSIQEASKNGQVKAALPLSQPNSTAEPGEVDGLNRKKIVMWQVLGYYQGKPFAFSFDRVLVIPASP